MKTFSLPKNPLFAFLLIFLGIIFLSYLFKNFIDEGFLVKVKSNATKAQVAKARENLLDVMKDYKQSQNLI